jgi:hypothetical protein
MSFIYRERKRIATQLTSNIDTEISQIRQLFILLGKDQRYDQPKYPILDRVGRRPLRRRRRACGNAAPFLLQTNASVTKMLAQSIEANQNLGRMKSDLSIMSHKLAGSFLFRGVKCCK